MIKINFSLLISCLLFSHLVYSSTEVRPPDGPFVSMLRITVVGEPLTGVNKALETEEIEYKFEVPDLGRYSEKKPEIKAEGYNFLDIKPSIELPSTSQYSQVNKAPIQPNVFNQLPIQNEFKSSEPATPTDMPSKLRPVDTKHHINLSFDELPITATQDKDSQFYPSEWAQPNPLRPLNRMPKNNNNANFFNPNSMMGMPFSNQMPVWNSGNQTNNGYR